METCILTVIKDEHQYLREWIEYNIKLGISHLFIAEDFGSSSHNDIVSAYPQEQVSLLSVVDFYEDDGKRERMMYERNHLYKMQNSYFRNGLEYIKAHFNYDWCFVIDVDEYITLDDGFTGIDEVMSMFNEYDAISLQWENYGANGLIRKPDYSKCGIVDTYTSITCMPNGDRLGSTCKCVYNMRVYRDENYASQHSMNKKIHWCKTDFTQERRYPVYDNIWLRHYITKSWEEYVWKLKVRGMFHPIHRNYDTFFHMNPDLECRKDELIAWAEEYVEKHKGRAE